MRGDDDLVGVELIERIFNRMQRIGVPDVSASLHTRLSQRLEAELETLLGVLAGSAIVTSPVAEPTDQRRCDNDDLCHVGGADADDVVQGLSGDGLIGYNEDPTAGRPVDGHRTLVSRRGATTRRGSVEMTGFVSCR